MYKTINYKIIVLIREEISVAGNRADPLESERVEMARGMCEVDYLNEMLMRSRRMASIIISVRGRVGKKR